VNRFGAFLCIFLVSGFLGVVPASAESTIQNVFALGEDFFVRNKPQEALRFLEQATAEDPAHVQAFIYLGIVYHQLGRLDDAIEAYRKILPKGGEESARIAYNLGNVYFDKGNTEFARQYYSEAISFDPSLSSAWLNRANTLIKAGTLKDAILDYEQYLKLEPNSSKRSQIERLISFLQEEFTAEERRRIQAEEQARFEAERRRRLMEEVSASLQSAAEDSKGLSAGVEGVQGYEGEFELE
jgi:tetratricopeptide (TPR) repeat protein